MEDEELGDDFEFFEDLKFSSKADKEEGKIQEPVRVESKEPEPVQEAAATSAAAPARFGRASQIFVGKLLNSAMVRVVPEDAPAGVKSTSRPSTSSGGGGGGESTIITQRSSSNLMKSVIGMVLGTSNTVAVPRRIQRQCRDQTFSKS